MSCIFHSEMAKLQIEQVHYEVRIMQNGKGFNFIRKQGTLGVLTLVLVGIVAFASYRTSYPLTPETEMKTETETELSHNTEEKQDASAVLSGNTDIAAEKADVKEGQEKATKENVTNEKAANQKATDKKDTNEKETEEEKEQEAASVLSGSVISPTVQFSEDDSLSWPAAGTILMDYSMDGTVYFKTLNEYKYNPALIIGSAAGNPVVASAKGIVEQISVNEETGTTVTMNIGNNYELIYGELKELAVAEGDVVEQGQLLGYISEPTKYYCEEGSNLYFAMKKDGEIIDPCLYLE